MGNKDQSKSNTIIEIPECTQPEVYNTLIDNPATCLKISESLSCNVSEKPQKALPNILHNNLKNNIQCLLMNINKENQNLKNSFDNKFHETDQSGIQLVNLNKEMFLQTDPYNLAYDQTTPCKQTNTYSQQPLKRDTAKSCPNLPTRYNRIFISNSNSLFMF